MKKYLLAAVAALALGGAANAATWWTLDGQDGACVPAQRHMLPPWWCGRSHGRRASGGHGTAAKPNSVRAGSETGAALRTCGNLGPF
jgi:hypothetical protein